MEIALNDSYAIVKIGEAVEITDFDKFLDFYYSKEVQDLTHVIFDCSGWQKLDQMGCEFFSIKSKFKTLKENSVVFCCADEKVSIFLSQFSEQCGFGIPLFADSIEDAMKIILK